MMLRLPRTFYDDHADRALPTPEPLRDSRRFVWINPSDPALSALVSDAEFYADGNVDGCDWLVRAAQTLLATIRRAA